VNETSGNAKKETKRPKNMPQPAKKINGKISEHVAQVFADELVGGAKYLEASDVLEKFISTPKSMTSERTFSKATTIQIMTPVVEQSPIPKKSIPKRGRISVAKGKRTASYKTTGSIFSLDDRAAVTALEQLVDRFGKVSHMGILDKSYTFFVTQAHDAALYFKVLDKVAVVGGDPLCESDQFDSMLAEFAAYRKGFGWGIAFLGATSEFAEYAGSKNWVTMHFGVERVLNPLTNPVLLETGAGKRIISKSKELLRKNISLGIYIPKYGSDHLLQEQLVGIYKDWCSDRNDKPIVQAYMTVLDPFAIPELMVSIYTRDANDKLCGFAALRKIINGYHLDPCVAAPDAPRGISELLILSAMSLLQNAGISYLSLGFEPSAELGEITGMPKPAQIFTRSVHRRAFRGLPIGGKQAFFNKFHPDDAQQRDLHLIIPTRGLPRPKHMKALMHTANIDISKLIMEDLRKSLSKIGESRRTSAEEPRKDVGGEDEPHR
jgi:hypothetical protein